MGEKKQHYDDAMVMWKCRLNPGNRQRQLAVPPQRQVIQQYSQSTNNLPELYKPAQETTTTKNNIGQSVNLRSHSDIRYHMNVFESNYYLDKQRTDAYRRELDEQIKERNRRKMLEKQMSNGVELAPLLMRKSPSLPKLPLSSTDVTKNLNFSPRLDASTTLFSPQNYHQELSSQHQLRRTTENDQRQRDIEETQKHFTNWSLFWGRTGGGAPWRSNHKKENLFNLLHYHHNINRK